METLNKNMFEIDLNRLDEEWQNQPAFFFEYAEQLAIAKKEAELAKAKRHACRAVLFREIKSDPLEYFENKGQATVEGINNLILEQPTYRKHQKDCINADYKVELLYAAVNALNHRKSALERLVSLHGQNYFARPQATGAGTEVADGIKARAIANKKKRKKKKS